MEIAFPYEVNYSNRDHVAIKRIAESLIANEILLNHLAGVFEIVFEGAEINFVRLELASLERASLHESYLAKIVAQTEQSLEDFVEGVGKKYKIEILHKNKKLGAYFILLSVLIAGKTAYSFLSPDTPPIQINGDIQIVVDHINKESGIPIEKLLNAISTPVKNPKKLATAGVKFIAPAKSEKKAEIEISGSELTISRKTIDEFPNPELFENLPDELHIERMSSVLLDIHATDRDRGGVGWGGIAIDVWDKRVRFSIAPGINLNELSKWRVVDAEVDLIYSIPVEAEGQIRLRMINILRINNWVTKLE